MFNFTHKGVDVKGEYCPESDGVLVTIAAEAGIHEGDLQGADALADEQIIAHGHYKESTEFISARNPLN